MEVPQLQSRGSPFPPHPASRPPSPRGEKGRVRATQEFHSNADAAAKYGTGILQFAESLS